MPNLFLHSAFISNIEPKKVDEALTDPNRINAMQKELNQFIHNMYVLVIRRRD